MIAPFLLVLTLQLSAQSWSDALLLERSGDPSGAIRLYERWLQGNPADPSAPDVLIHAAFLHTDPVLAIQLLLNYADRLNPESSAPVWASLASLEAAIGRPEDAAAHYERAALTGGPMRDRWRLDALALRYSIGDAETVLSGADALIRVLKPGLLLDEAVSLAALATASLGSYREAIARLDSHLASGGEILSPLPLLAKHTIALQTGDSVLARATAEVLSREFPGSTAQYLSASRILEWTSPGGLMGRPDSARNGQVQVAAFSDRGNALDLRGRLESEGFVAWIEYSESLWRVVVNDPNGDAAARLRQRGYDELFGR